MVEAEKVAEVLGGLDTLGRDVYTDLEMADLVMAGLPFKVLEALLSCQALTSDDIAIIMPRSTYFKHKKNDESLTPEQSDRAERLARVFASAMVVFRNPEKAARWIRKPNRAMNGRRPVDLVQTDAGFRTVEATLGRIAHGIFS